MLLAQIDAQVTEINLTQLAGGLDYLLSWIGLGCLVGLAVAAFLGRRQPTNSVATMVIAIVGTLLGCGLLQFFDPGQNVRPLTPPGLAVGITGALLLLMFFGLLGGYLPESEAETPRRGRRRRALRQYLQED